MRTLQQLENDFFEFKSTCDIVSLAKVIRDVFSCCEMPEVMQSNLWRLCREHAYVLYYAVEIYLQKGEWQIAYEFSKIILAVKDDVVCNALHILGDTDLTRQIGICAYFAGDLQTAAINFSKISDCEIDDVNLYMGNIAYISGDYRKALEYYARALKNRNDFSEAKINSVLALKAMGNRSEARRYNLNKEEYRSALLLDRFQMYQQVPSMHRAIENYLQIPIFICSRDRLGCLRKLVNWLQSAGYKDIRIVDNCSTYQPLLSYYEKLEKQNIRIYRLNENIGHKSLWNQCLLADLPSDMPYIYTDSDVVPSDACPANVLKYL